MGLERLNITIPDSGKKETVQFTLCVNNSWTLSPIWFSVGWEGENL
jgi:hypothetical protein